MVLGKLEVLRAYVWGAGTIRTMHCGICGCVTHWEPVEKQAELRLGVNMRNFEASAVAEIRVRHFDGADRWVYLD